MRKLPIVLCFSLSFGIVGFSQEPAGGNMESAVPVGIRGVLDQELTRLGWKEGPNQVDGKTVFVSTGVGVIQVDRGGSGHNYSRNAAYEKAMLRAKQFMAEYLGEQIATQAILSYHEGGGVPPAGGGVEFPQSLGAKVYTLAHAKLDVMLEENGVEKPKQIPQADLRKIALASEEYQKLTLQFASAALVGCQSFKILEHYPEVGNGQIAVIMVYSPKLVDMAYALASGGSMPKTEPKTPVADQIPSNPEELLRNFGVSLRINEEGEYVLVAYGQSTATTASTQSSLMAERKAKLQAMGQLRGFAGESVEVMSALMEAENLYEFENGARTRRDSGGYSEVIQSTSEGMEIVGSELVKRWSYADPASGENVHGVVLAWSPAKRKASEQYRHAFQKQSNAPASTEVDPETESTTYQSVTGDQDAL
jgi:hypothetical protein